MNNIENELDDIGNSLKDSQKTMTQINSGFLRNIFRIDKKKNKKEKSLTNDMNSQGSSIEKTKSDKNEISNTQQNSSIQLPYQSMQTRQRNNDPNSEDDLEENFDKMSEGLFKLKGIASNMSVELDRQNSQIERLDLITLAHTDTLANQTNQMKKKLRKPTFMKPSSIKKIQIINKVPK